MSADDRDDVRCWSCDDHPDVAMLFGPLTPLLVARIRRAFAQLPHQRSEDACKRGHPVDDVTHRRDTHGYLICRVCTREQRRERRQEARYA